mmetsp:Transcript_16193/g.13767  ORF Transcript_16193/g.13767 Transcript_16193/m.13767 type:complete len:161 (+) Transcript_16193:613-1095(+)|eukprot:CAMPEP_0114585324 /NCGR_PEP_ID=MMETSP0125-20121206/8911_1 /TAXON_ID=485358 ORGANISM="Aristerostoma sp., Strain ATCC 50986" /NCGR_SAMPLE_ID=MMETSP0125 /ASSEMBLY_ACC=CAM_ASM_000245 /LENGTH=160 /DNA_ID=CAMNT_0001780375 /DNA_START=794 /DNA_END=1276 /DNA_ORIENTATION=+
MSELFNPSKTFTEGNHARNKDQLKDLFQNYTLENKILLFDEAHNVERSAEDGISFVIGEKTFDDCQKDLKILEKKIKQRETKNSNFKGLNQLKSCIKEVKDGFKHLCHHKYGTTLPAHFIKDMFKDRLFKSNSMDYEKLKGAVADLSTEPDHYNGLDALF